MKFDQRLRHIILSIVTVIAIALVHTFALASLAEHEVDAVASQATVVIARQLDKKTQKPPQNWETGSGVIVARRGKTYYVLTAKDVVETQGVFYGVRTSDGKMHVVDRSKDNSSFRSLALDEGELSQKAQDLDLALVKFNSDADHVVAPLGNSQQLRQTDSLYVSGWPNPKNKSPRRSRITEKTAILSETPGKPHGDSIRGIAYKIQTRESMDGAPLFNDKGEVVAIHRREHTPDNQYCIASQLSANTSCGVPMAHILRTRTAEKLRLRIGRAPISSQIIARGIKNKPKADKIANVYNLFAFNVDAMLRNQPSLGCGSLLLGDKKCPSRPK
ncbi:MAG: serine protease [Calothrix sp. MO_167.B12]|nr:serine protease [Calothrix sp. MO_167.B12]